MKRLDSREDLAMKVESESGIDAVLDYGYQAEHMPEGDTELAEAWRELSAAYTKYEALAEKVAHLIGLE